MARKLTISGECILIAQRSQPGVSNTVPRALHPGLFLSPCDFPSVFCQHAVCVTIRLRHCSGGITLSLFFLLFFFSFRHPSTKQCGFHR